MLPLLFGRFYDEENAGCKSADQHYVENYPKGYEKRRGRGCRYRNGGYGDDVGVKDILCRLTCRICRARIAEVDVCRLVGRAVQPEAVARLKTPCIVHVAGLIPVGYYRAPEAPFAAENVGQKRVVGTCPDCAHAVERAHHAVCAAFLDAHFEGLEIELAESLLGKPGVLVVGVCARFADREVLDACDQIAGKIPNLSKLTRSMSSFRQTTREYASDLKKLREQLSQSRRMQSKNAWDELFAPAKSDAYQKRINAEKQARAARLAIKAAGQATPAETPKSTATDDIDAIMRGIEEEKGKK